MRWEDGPIELVNCALCFCRVLPPDQCDGGCVETHRHWKYGKVFVVLQPGGVGAARQQIGVRQQRKTI